MIFLYPSLLWALFLIAIPIIIHLFNFKVHKVVYFSNIKFLANIKDVSESKSKIKNLIILLCRILAISALVIAFSGPFLLLSDKNLPSQKKIVCIYLDNSFSMNSGSEFGNLFDASKERIRKIVSSYNPTQKYLFITNDLDSKHRIATNKEQLINFVNQCQISPSSKSISEITNYVKNFLDQEGQFTNNKVLFYMISDFQKNISDFDKIKNDSLYTYYILPLANAVINNLYIDSCWFSGASKKMNAQEELVVRIFNKGSEPYSDIPIKLTVNNKQKSVSSFSIEPNQSIDFPIQFSNTEKGILPCNIEISDYPITYDNNLFFNYQINNKTSILIISNKLENKYVQALFKSDSAFSVNQIFYSNIKTSEFVNYQLIILDEPEILTTGLSDELKKFVSKGGSLVLMPSKDTQIDGFNKLSVSLQGPQIIAFENQEIGIDKINFQHFLYKDVFTKTDAKLNLPSIKSYFNIKSNLANPYQEIFGSVSGKPLLIQHNLDRGKVYTFCFPLSISNSNFIVHQLFVPTLYNIAAYSQGKDDLYYTINKDYIIDINLRQSITEQVLHVVNSSSQTDFIPYLSSNGEMGHRLDFKNNIKWADNYFLKNGDSLLKCISFNFDRKESNTEFYSKKQILEIIEKNKLTGFKTISANINDLELEMAEIQNERQEFWKLFLFIAFLSLAAEILIIRLWKDRQKPIQKNEAFID